ncbi:MAG: NfeD family protein, partial [Candidatus Atribacteria bacterium]|nr:NfeD family protein [Candidatus Atribacteria bacterium]
AYETEEKGWEPSLVGKTGIAKSMLRPAGIVEIEGKRWDAITEGEFISPGTRVKVEKIKGNTIVVKSEEGG